MAIQMTAKEKLQMKAAANKAQQDRLRASMPAADPGFMERLQEEERQRQAIANAERVRAQRSRTVEMPPIPKEPVSDRAKKVAEIRADIDTTPAQGKAGKAAQSIGLNTMASVQYLGETAKQFKENTDTFLDTQEAADYAAAVSEFNRVRRYAMEDSPEYIAAQRAMEQARARMEQASEEAQSKTVDPDSLGSRMMGESMRLKEEALEGTEGAGRFLAETGMSVASNLAKLPLGAAAPALMGAEAAAGKAYELQQQGVGAGQALTRGVTSGVIEGITEKMGLDNLFDLIKTGGKTAVKNVLKQAGVEGTEEGFSYVFNLLADKVAKDPNAQFNWDELLQSIASGAISGLFFGAAGTAANRGQANPGVITQTGKEKQAPAGTSLHLADGQVQGLPVVEKPVEDAQSLPLPKTENKKTAGQSQAAGKKDRDNDQKSVVTKLQEKIPELQSEPILREVQGTEFDKSQGKLTDTVGAFFKAIGNKVFRKGLGNVILDERSIRSDIAHGIGKIKAATFTAVPDVIEKGKQIDYHENWKGRGDESFVYAGKVNVDGKPAYLAAVVLRGADSRFYLHEVVDEKGNIIYARKDANTGVQDRGGRENGDTGASVASSGFSVAKNETAVKPEGLLLPRQESLQEALTASVTGGRTLGENERRTGLPLPSAVEGQLEALEALTTPLDNDDYDVNVIRKYMGEDAALYWLEHKDEEAGDLETGRPKPEQSGAVTDEQGNVVGTQATEKLGVRIEGSLADMGKVQKAREAQWGLDAANKQIEKAEKDLHASAAEKRMAESVAKGIDTLDSFKYGWDGRDNRRRSVVEQLSALYRLRDTYDRNAVKALGRHNKDVFIDKLNKDILNHLDKATPPGAASLHTNTWERNNLRTWGRELGTKVNELIFDPIRRNEANRIRWLDKQADDMKILGDLTDAENEAVFDMLDNGKETATYDGVRNDVVQEAADQLRLKYSQYYDAINDVLVAHGYPEIGFIKNYAPHRQPEQMQSAMSIFEKLGLSETVNELPTELAGRTDIFKPGKKWNPYFLHRTGQEAAPDAVGGFLSYLNYMSEVLYHVDDIQKVRTFGDQIRYLYGDEGLKADYDAIRADTTLNEQEKELELARIRERQTDNSKMGNYVTQLDDYANILAGKQTMVDRALEKGVLGRLWLNTIQKPVQILVRSSIPGNISSAINQTVQLPWLTAEAGEGNVLQAAFELLGGKLKREGFAGQSDFITGKRGAETYNAMKDKTTGEKVLDAASIPFEAVDDATSQVIVRAFYLKNIKAGMEHDAALRMADKQAEKLVGSRMKGSKANIFSDKSFKLLTTFQLEVANQWQHLKFDLPQEYREIERTRGTAAAVAEATKRITKGAIYTFALNSLIEQITGNKPAGFDIIGAIRDYIQAGQPDEEDEEQKFDWEAGLKDLRDTAINDLPFVGTIANTLFDVGDGRLPIPQVKPGELWKAGVERVKAETDEEKTAANKKFGASLLHNVAAVMPMGGQIKKTIQGTSDVVRGGRYTNDGTQLMYEVEQSVPNAIRGALFGRNALPETREYWDEGGKKVLSEDQTALMKKAEGYGVDQSVYVDFIQQAKKLKGDKDAEGKTIDGSRERKEIALIDSLDITDEQKLQLYLDNVASESRAEDVEALRNAGMTWEEMAPAVETYLSLGAGELNATQKATELAVWADRNLQPEPAAAVKERLDYWQMMRAEATAYEKLTEAGLKSESAQLVFDTWQALEPEEGKTSVSVNQKRRAVAESKKLSEADKRLAIRTTIDGDSALAEFDNCVKAGVRMTDYVEAKIFAGTATADKNEKGKTITNSKRNKIWKRINALNATPAQKNALSAACGYDKELNEAPWYNGVVSTSLPGLPLPNANQKYTMPELPKPEADFEFAMPPLPLP